MQVGQNAYEADVLTAIKTNQREIFYDIVGIKPIKIETSGKAHVESKDSGSRGSEISVEASGGTHVESEDSRSRLPEASEQSIAQASGESNANEAAVLKTTYCPFHRWRARKFYAVSCRVSPANSYMEKPMEWV